jgi:NAD(P)-dependent dehydrogenase (short-subunit alcohol dehydrogenase family)
MGTRLQEKTALMTGAICNIGRAVVTVFVAEGHMSSSAAAASSATPRLSIRSARQTGAPASSQGIRMAGVVPGRARRR